MKETSDLDPQKMIRAARSGNTEALGQLMQMYRSYLRLLARLQIGVRLQQKIDASDVVQETFAKAALDFENFRGNSEGELMTWLRQILARTLANLIRHYGTLQRDVRLERSLDQSLTSSSQAMHRWIAAAGSSPSQHSSRREQAVLLSEALDKLPDDYREVLVLRNLEGHSFPDVARAMDRSLDSVKNLWTRALVQMRRALEGL